MLRGPRLGQRRWPVVQGVPQRRTEQRNEEQTGRTGRLAPEILRTAQLADQVGKEGRAQQQIQRHDVHQPRAPEQRHKLSPAAPQETVQDQARHSSWEGPAKQRAAHDVHPDPRGARTAVRLGAKEQPRDQGERAADHHQQPERPARYALPSSIRDQEREIQERNYAEQVPDRDHRGIEPGKGAAQRSSEQPPRQLGIIRGRQRKCVDQEAGPAHGKQPLRAKG